MIKHIKILILILFLSICTLNDCNATHPAGISQHSVDIITGSYIETNTDIMIPGPLPVVLKREFNPSAKTGGYPLANGWQWKIFQPVEQIPKDESRLHIAPNASSSNELESVKVLGANNHQTFSWLRFNTQNDWLELTSHDGQNWRLHIDNGVLKKVIASGDEEISYEYSGGQISMRKTSNGHELINEFYRLGQNELDSSTIDITDPKDPRIGRVKRQKTITDLGKTPITIAEYHYNEDSTEVIDALGMKKLYRYSKKLQRVTGIEVYDNNTLVRVERFNWFSQSGKEPKLTFHAILSPEGSILKSQRYDYDQKGRLVKETLSGTLSGEAGLNENYSSTKVYSDEGLLTSESEDNGRYTTYHYDPENLLVLESETGYGATPLFRTEFVYDSQGILIKTIQTDIQSDKGDQKITSITPSQSPHSAGLPVLIEDTLSNSNAEKSIRTVLNTYTQRAMIAKQEIFDSESSTKKVLRKDFDVKGREIYSSDTSKGDVLTVYYDDENMIVQTDMETGEITESCFNFQKRVISRKLSKIEGNTLSQTNQYDDQGHLISSCDVLSNETTFVYDSLGRLIEKTDPPVLNQDDQEVRLKSTYRYNSLDQMISFTDPNGDTTHFSYTARNKPCFIEHPDGSTDEFVYNLDGTLYSHKARDGKKIIYDRDGLGRVIETRFFSEENNYLESKTASYPGWGEIETRDDAGKVHSFNFDEEGKLEKKLPLKAVKQSKDISEHLNYDFKNERGQRALQKTIVQPNGSMIVSTFDALGRIEKVEVKDPLGNLIAEKECRYDGAGHMVKQRDTVIRDGSICKIMETRWTYGPGGHLKEKIEDANTSMPRIFSYDYNKFGKLTSLVKPDGVSLTYIYHPSGELQRITSSDGSIDCEYFYDNKHRVTQAIDHATGSCTYRDYNEEGRLIREHLANGIEITNLYDDDGKRIQMNLPGGRGIRYDYQEKKLAAIHRLLPDGSALYSHVYSEYNKKGFLKEARLIGGLGNLSIRRNQHNLIQSLSSSYGKQKISYADGRLTKIVDENSLGKTQNLYDYNELGQLIQDGDEFLSYDSVDNLLTKGFNAFEVNDHNQVVKLASTTYAYDQNGNLMSKNENGTNTFYQYDALDRLTKVQTKDKTITYVHDPFHRRISKQIHGEDPIHFILDSDNEIGSANSSLEIKELRILGLGHGAEIGAAVAIEIGENIFAPIHDHRGSVIALVDAKTKKVAEFYQYEAFGAEKIFDNKGNEIDPADSINPYRFSSKRIDCDTALIHFGKREYDPKLCRWISQDPLGFFDGTNRYAFARNNPMQMLDLYGFFSISNIWESINSASRYLNTHVTDCLNGYLESFHPLDIAHQYLYEIGSFLVGDRYLLLSGFYNSKSHTGVYGGGFEPHEKYRISFINGILTARQDLEYNLALISESHGGCNVHYCYVGTKGWTHDLVRSIFTKMGHVSPEAKALAGIWHDLIDDMGGVDNGGIIFHYAHSLGGTETLLAKYLLTPEEQKMIHVITMGSPTLIPDDGFHSVVNIISCRDVISIFDPVTFIYSILFGDTNVFFVGSPWDGWPIVDHTFLCYWQHWQDNFWHEYQDMLNELFQ